MSDAKIACLCGMGKGQAAYRLGLFLPFPIHRHGLVLHRATETNDRRNSRLQNKEKRE